MDVGTHLATELAHVVSATAPEPPLWPLDTALRPEGKDGALVRTLDSHLAHLPQMGRLLGVPGPAQGQGLCRGYGARCPLRAGRGALRVGGQQAGELR